MTDEQLWPDDESLISEGELAGAAASYCEFVHRQLAAWPMPYQTDVYGPYQTWRFHGDFWNPSEDPVETLKKARVLIDAEIARLEVIRRDCCGEE